MCTVGKRLNADLKYKLIVVSLIKILSQKDWLGEYK